MLACTLCHNRKIRCVPDTDSASCASCKAAGVQCVPRTRKRRRVASAPYSEQASHARSPIKHPAPSHDSAQGTGSEPTAFAEPQAAYQTPSTSQTATYIGRGHYVTQDDEIDERSARAFEPVQVGPHLSTRHATMALWKSFDVPPSAARRSLLSAFLDFCDIWTPVMEPKDIEELSRDEIEPKHLLLAQALWLAGSRITSAPSVVAFASSDDFYHRAKALFWSDTDTDPMTAIKASLMLQWYNPQAPEHVSFDNSGFWLKLGVGVAHQIGLHREPSPGPSQAIRRRLWWCLVVRDSLISVAHGRPRVINLDDSDVQPPTQSDFPDSAYNFQLFSSWVDICQVLGDISTCCMRRHMSRTKRLYIESSLYRWPRSLPMDLRVAASDQPPNSYFPSAQNFAARQLYIPYLISLIVLSRMQHTAGSVSLTAALAASFVARIFEDFLARDEIRVLAPIFTRYCLIASMALVSVMPHQQLWKAAQADLSTFQQSLTELSKRWRSAIGATKALKNAISKRQQRPQPLNGTVGINAEQSLQYFETIDLGYCWMWKTVEPQLSMESPAIPQQMQMPPQPLDENHNVGPMLNNGLDLDLSTIQFEHVENWILNDGYLFDP